MAKLPEKQKIRIQRDKLRQRVRDLLNGAGGFLCVNTDDSDVFAHVGMEIYERWVSSCQTVLYNLDGKILAQDFHRYATINSAVEFLWERRGNFVEGALQ